MPGPAPLSSFKVRPRFSHTVAGSVADTRARLLAALAERSAELEVKAFPDFIGVHIAAPARQTWSPRLFLQLEAVDPETTRIEGIYGPEIEVWSIFLYGYMITAVLGSISATYGLAQVLIKETPWAFEVTGAMGIAALVLYLGAQMGQKLGAAQTFQLHQAYQEAIEAKATT